MAFNPFHEFRKRQKVVFAVMTIVAMLTFVLMSGMSGGGDFASWFMSLFGGKGRTEYVAHVYGKGVTARQLQELTMQRQIAQLYMFQATEVVWEARRKEITPPNLQGLPPDHQRMLAQKMAADPVYMQLQRRVPTLGMNLPPQFQSRFLYFGGALNTEGMLDFVIWLKQADKLNIQLSEKDVRAEVDRLLANRLPRKDSAQIEQGLRQNFKDYTSAMLVSAIGNELRVQIAQDAMLGGDTDGRIQGSSISRRPTPITPEEFWDFFKEQQTKLTLRLIPVPVEDFIEQVKEKPAEKEIDELYKKHKDKEYSPEDSEPGFKQPRRIQVEWVSGKWDDPYYKGTAERYLPNVQAVELIAAGALASPLAGLAPAVQIGFPAVVDTMVPAGKDPRNGEDTTLYREYDNTKWRLFPAASYVKAWRWGPFPMHDRNIEKPINVASAIGLAAGGPQVGAIAGLGAFEASATFQESQDRIARGLTWMLSGTQPTPVGAAALSEYLTPANEYLPLHLVRDQLQERLLTYLAQDMVGANLRTITKEVESRKKDPKAVAEYLAKAVAEYHLQSGKTTELRDEHRKKFADDPGLKSLFEAYTKPPSRDPTGRQFAFLFLRDAKPFVVEHFPLSALKLEDDSDWRSAQEKFLYWKTEDQPAKIVPLTDATVRAEVERAWKMQKARELAKKEADQLAIKAREEKGDARKLRDFAEKNNRKLIELDPIAKRMQTPSFRPDTAYTYEPPRIPTDKVPNAGNDFVTKLLEFKAKEKGDTLVQSDQPQRNYYVAVLIDKQEPTMDDFMRVYREASSDAARKDPMLQMFEHEKQGQYIQEFMKRLREDALVINKDALKGSEGSGGADD